MSNTTNDLTPSPSKDTDLPKPKYAKPLRTMQIYKGEPPQDKDGKIPQEFVIQERCNLEFVNPKTEKKQKCNQKLHVVRVKHQKFESDDSGYGGQLIYDEKDIRQYVVCPDHGGLPIDFAKW